MKNPFLFFSQVTDFGLHELRNSSDAFIGEYEEEHNSMDKLLWTAPELLRDEKVAAKGTQKGDVYAFGEFERLKVTHLLRDQS